MKELLVKTNNPAALDAIVMQMGAAVVGGGTPDGYQRVGDAYVVRCFSDPDFIRFVITNQGYGEVVGERELENPND